MSFFFSSRRRHTRFDCDWSSDVCSSDLASLETLRRSTLGDLQGGSRVNLERALAVGERLGGHMRWEGGWVGEGGRFRGEAHHLKKKKIVNRPWISINTYIKRLVYRSITY